MSTLRSFYVLCSLVAAVVAAGCSIKTTLLQNELQALERRSAACEALGQELNANPVPDAPSDFGVFIPATLINNALAGFVDDTVEVATDPPSNVTLKKFTTMFACDAANVTIAAEATRGSLGATLEMEAVAVVRANPDPKVGTAEILLNVEEVRPTVKVAWFQFALQGFVRDLVKVAFINYSQKLPVVTVPLRHTVQMTVPDSRMNVHVPTGAGSADGVLTVPGLTRNPVLQVRRTMFLDDGIYAYFNVH